MKRLIAIVRYNVAITSNSHTYEQIRNCEIVTLKRNKVANVRYTVNNYRKHLCSCEISCHIEMNSQLQEITLELREIKSQL